MRGTFSKGDRLGSTPNEAMSHPVAKTKGLHIPPRCLHAGSAMCVAGRPWTPSFFFACRLFPYRADTVFVVLFAFT